LGAKWRRIGWDYPCFYLYNLTSANEVRQSDDSQQPGSEGRSQKEQPPNRPAAIAAVVSAIANYEDAKGSAKCRN